MLCVLDLKSINRLFLHCPVAADLWHMFLSVFWSQLDTTPRISRKPLKVETFGKSANASRTSSK
uniref:Putative ovule protein n=1 Tax=Solanum chacoense TaxID=4108 RepID=A0A0V0HDZ1_SOLCH